MFLKTVMHTEEPLAYATPGTAEASPSPLQQGRGPGRGGPQCCLSRGLGSRSCFAALFLVVSFAAAAPPNLPRPLLTVRKVNAGTNIAAAIWEQPPTVSRFYFTKLGRQATQRTEVRLAYDDANLYAAFRCLDSGKGKKGSVSPEGELVPDADSASLLLDLDNDRKTYVMFTTTASGRKTAESGRQFIHKAWNVAWSVETNRQGSTWQALMTIPFSSLGVSTPAAGTRWGAQLSRYDPGTKRPVFWSQVRKDPRETQRSGDITFAGPEQVSASISDVNVVVPGRQGATVYVSNPTGKPATLKVQILNDGLALGTAEIESRAGESSVPLPFDYPTDGWHALTISIADSSGHLIMRSPGIPVRLTSYASRLAHYTKVASAQNAPSPTLAEEKKAVLSQIAGLQSRAAEASGDLAKWNLLRHDVDAAEKAVGRLRSACADPVGRGYAVGTETALRKILRDKLFEGDYGTPVRLELARNEFESTQLAVSAHGQALEKVQISVSDLRGPGALLSSNAVELHLVEFVQTGEPPYEIEYVGWYPDPLMPYQPFNLARGEIRPIWITVHTPGDLPAGTYKGTVTVKPANAQETQIPFEVKIWDFALPATPHLKTAFAFFDYEYRGWYGSPINGEQRRQAEKLLLDHHLNPTDIYSKKPRPAMEDLPFCVDHGLNAFNLSYVGRAKSASARAEVAALIRQQEKLLKSKGWWDKAFVYGFDEVGSSRYPDVQSVFGWLKQEFPDLPRMCTVMPNPQLKGYVNIWVPLIANFDYDESQPYIGDGDEVWWYVCCGPERPWPNFFVDYPATDPRIIFWMNWKYQVPGFLYWTVNRWHTNLKGRSPAIQKQIDAGKRWPEVPWQTQTTASFNGDGHLVYPGPDGRLLSSIRLESIRDGIDDYEYFHLLNTLARQAGKNPQTDKLLVAKAKKLLEVQSQVVTSRTEFTTDPQVVLEARRELAGMIELLSRTEKTRN